MGTYGSGTPDKCPPSLGAVGTDLMTTSELARRHRVTVRGSGTPVVVLAHGLGGGPSDWDAVAAGLEAHCTVVTFAQAGSLAADPMLFVPARHRTVYGFVDDLANLLVDLDLEGVTFVGHSFGGIVGALAECAAPGLIDRMVLLNGSARYLADPATGYAGGFTAEQVRDLRVAVNADQAAWARDFVPDLMGADNPSAVSEALTAALERHDEEVAACIAAAVFGLDARRDLVRCRAHTLLLHSALDPAVPDCSYETLLGLLPDARGVRLDATGHFAHRVAPDEVLSHLVPFVLADR